MAVLLGGSRLCLRRRLQPWCMERVEVSGFAGPRMQSLPVGMPLLHTGNAARPELDVQAARSASY